MAMIDMGMRFRGRISVRKTRIEDDTIVLVFGDDDAGVSADWVRLTREEAHEVVRLLTETLAEPSSVQRSERIIAEVIPGE